MSTKPFLSNVNESLTRRESNKYVEGLNSKVRLELYKTIGKEVEFNWYLHEISDARTRLLFRSGTHGLNEELGRHKGRNGMTGCMYVLCVEMSVRVLSMSYGSRGVGVSLEEGGRVRMGVSSHYKVV